MSQSPVHDGESVATEPLSTHLVRVLRRDLGTAPRVALFLVYPDGMEVRELRAGAAIVVGREPPSDVCIDDARLSRRHVRFAVTEDLAKVEVEDLGSRNGTWVGGRRIERERVAVGGEVMLGGVLARLRRVVTRDDWQEDVGGGEAAPVFGPRMAEVMRLVKRVASSTVPTILLGETGAGKEVVARRIHDLSPRRERPMLCVNCGAIPKELVESTFFGHERGAFTGAAEVKKGVFEAADGGTVFLDEIGELPAAAQAALLRVLETGRVVRVGGTRELAVDVRVIAATHKDLPRMVEAGTFRADLYFRLGAVTIDLPPLRDRKGDIEPLARHFLRAAATTHGRDVHDLSPGAIERLAAYDWPGNARELRNVILRAVVLAEGEVIEADDLPAHVRGPASATSTETPVLATTATTAAPQHEEPARGEKLRERVQAYEIELLREALAEAGGNRAEAAKRLGMPLRTLAYKIKTFGLDEPEA